jgi:hypothetical protein
LPLSVASSAGPLISPSRLPQSRLWPARSPDEEHDKITTATKNGARLAEARLAAIA